MYDLVCAKIEEWVKAYTGPLFHAAFCDSPYHLTSITKRFGKADSAPAKFGQDGAFGRLSKGFQGETWDGGDVAFNPDTWSGIAKLVHPGGFIIAYGGTRTYHRMVMAMEMVGLIIHPAIVWLQSQGWPKATRIDTQIDRDAGVKREKSGKARHRNVKPYNDENGWNANSTTGDYEYDLPATDLAKAWAGHRYGLQALKPTAEFIAVAQVPYSGRPVDNITQTGAGALNIDATRLPINPDVDDPRLGGHGSWRTDKAAKHVYEGGYEGIDVASSPDGRWPTNVVMSHTPDCRLIGQRKMPGYTINRFTDGAKVFGGGAGHPYVTVAKPDEIMEVWDCADDCPIRRLNEQSGVLTSGTDGVRQKAVVENNYKPLYGKESRSTNDLVEGYGDSGGASRFYPNFDWNAETEEAIALADSFYYNAKVSSDERNAGLKGKQSLLKLRDDLTPQQRNDVLDELKRLGINDL